MPQFTVYIGNVEYRKVCNFYLSEKGCRHGDSCNYLHVDFCPDCADGICNGKCGWPKAIPVLNVKNKPIPCVWQVVNNGEQHRFFYEDAKTKKANADRKAQEESEAAAVEAKVRAEKSAEAEKAMKKVAPYLAPTPALLRDYNAHLAIMIQWAADRETLNMLNKKFADLLRVTTEMNKKFDEAQTAIKERLKDVSDEDLDKVPFLFDHFFPRTQ